MVALMMCNVWPTSTGGAGPSGHSSEEEGWEEEEDPARLGPRVAVLLIKLGKELGSMTYIF
jgi:hypothetical protein